MVHLYHTSHKCISCHNLTKTLYLTIFCLTSHQGCCQPTASQCHLNKMVMTWNARLSLQHFTITITDADLPGCQWSTSCTASLLCYTAWSEKQMGINIMWSIWHYATQST